MNIFPRFLLMILLIISVGCVGNPPETETELNQEQQHRLPTDPENIPAQEAELPDVSIATREEAMEALNHSDLRVRWQAVSFIKGQTDTAFEDLKKAINSEHEDVASAAVSAIRNCGTAEEVIPVLTDALDHQFATAQAEAVIGLGQMGNAAKSAVSAIETRMIDADPRFVEKAKEALKQIQNQ